MDDFNVFMLFRKERNNKNVPRKLVAKFGFLHP